MDRQPRLSMATLRGADVPEEAGVYALYREGERMYVGKANSLQDRVWKNHSARGNVLTGSALRRNVAQALGIASAADIKARRYQPTEEELLYVRRWLDGCDITWVVCATKQRAEDLEKDIKAEFTPPLTKR
jgi:hypothetical protein